MSNSPYTGASSPLRPAEDSSGSLHLLAGLLHMQGKDAEATRLHRCAENIELASAASKREIANQEHHPQQQQVARKEYSPAMTEGEHSMMTLAELHCARANYEEALRLQHKLLERKEHHLGKDHGDLVPILISLARMYEDAGRPYEAQSIRERVGRLSNLSLY